MIVLVFLPVIIALIVVLAKKVRFYTSVLVTCAAVAVGSVLLLVLVNTVSGMSMAEFVLSFVDDYLSSNPDFTRLLYATYNGISDLSAVTFDEAFASVSSMVVDSLVSFIPAFFAGFSAIGGLVLYLIVRAIGKAAGGKVVTIPAFSDYRLPRHFGRWSAICFVVVLIGYLNAWPNFNIVYAVVAALLGSIYYIQGLCFLDYLIKKRLNVPVIVLILAAVTLLLYQAIMFIGIIEQIIKLRNRIDQRNSDRKNGGQL